jgi:serine/threonine protein kinase
MHPVDGPEIDGITIISKVHDGRWSAVYEAIDTRTGQALCIKQIRAGDAPVGNERVRQILEDIRWRRLPCLPAFVGSLYEQDETVLIMEWVPGLDPVAHCAEYDLEPRVRAMAAQAICRSLQTLHDQGIIHRDVKPKNVIIDPEGRAVFIDLESSRLESWDTVTGSGEIVGTRGFMAPEIVQGKPVTVQSDIYSVGRVFELMLVHARSEAERERLKQERDPRLDAIVARACADRPEDRYRSAAAMATDIERYLAGDSLEAMPSRIRSWTCTARRNWPLTAALACIVVLLGVAAMGWIRAERNSSTLRANLETQTLNFKRAEKSYDAVQSILTMLRGFRQSVDEHAEAGSFGEAMMHIRMLDDLREAAEIIEPGSSADFTDSRVPVVMDALRAMYTPPLTDHEEDFAAIRRALEHIETVRNPKG